MSVNVYHEKDGDLNVLKGKTIGIIGYGNQAKAQALNMRDSGLEVVIGFPNDEYKKRAAKDRFDVKNISEVVKDAEYTFLLISDEIMAEIYELEIKPHLKENQTLVFYSGYNIVFGKISVPNNVDILLISPRLPGKGVRENFLNGKGNFSLIGVHQDSSGKAKSKLLALGRACGATSRGGVEISLRRQTIMGLFINQTFTFGFLQIMMRSISNLIAEGYPPEAVFVELFLSGEASFTIDKIIDVGMIKQMNFHSQTSQYGQMSRGMKYMKVANDIAKIQEKIFSQIENGEYAKEWDDEKSSIKLRIMKYIASNVKFADIEESVRKNLGFVKQEMFEKLTFPSEEEISKYPELKDDIDQIKAFYSDV